MTRPRKKKIPAKTKRRTARKKKTTFPAGWFPLRKFIYTMLLFGLLVFSVAVLGYVIFFRTVVAAQLPFEEHDIVFEEPYLPAEAETIDPKAMIKLECPGQGHWIAVLKTN